MCGIIGIVGVRPVTERLIDSLKRLEYRGYDSAGVAGFQDGHVERRRAAGKIRALEAVLDASPLAATVGIGHTRWATHGAPSERNAHPHRAGRVTLVHNGILLADAVNGQVTHQPDVPYVAPRPTDQQGTPNVTPQSEQQGMKPQMQMQVQPQQNQQQPPQPHQ